MYEAENMMDMPVIQSLAFHISHESSYRLRASLPSDSETQSQSPFGYLILGVSGLVTIIHFLRLSEADFSLDWCSWIDVADRHLVDNP